MADAEENSTVFRFDDFTVDPKTRVLSRNGETIALTPRVFDTLLAFIRRPGETVTKDELMAAIWPDSFVEESNLTQNVAVLRKALGENSRERRFIVTVPGRGYRFVPDVSRGNGAAEIVDREVRDSPPAVATAPSTASKRWRNLWIILAAVIVTALGGAVYYFLIKGSFTAPTVARTRQITSFSGLDLYPAFSPSGNSLAFSSNKSGAFEIYIRQMTPGAAEIQLTSDGNHNFQPSFSPDGSRVAFYSVQRGGIWVVPASGGTPRRLSEFGSSPAWSPDGTTIAFQSDPLNDFGSGVRNAMPPSTLWIVPADGGVEPRQLTTVGTPPGGHGAPEWSPDGTRILFDANDWATSNLWSIASDGSDLRPVLANASSILNAWRSITACDAVYSRDGRSIYYVGDMGMSIHTVGVDRAGQATGAPAKVFDAAASRVRHITVGPDGKRLVYSAISTSSNLYLNELIGGKEWSAPKQLTRSSDSRVVSPSFSPDGSKIAFQENTTGSYASISIMDTDGGNRKQVTTRAAFNPTWFPAGDRVGFSVPRGEHSEYWFAAADGSVERKLFEYGDKEIFNGRLSPDAKFVLFNSKRSGTINIWRISVEGGVAEQLTSDPEMAGFAAMSRDGNWIGFQLKRGGDTHIAYMPANGGAIVQLTNEPGQSWLSDWAPDNDRLIFAGRRGSIWNIYSVSRTTGEIKRLTNFDQINSYVRYPAWSPRGDKIAYEYAESQGNLWMIELN